MMVTIGGIPVFDALVTDAETGMFKISLVDDPAVMSNFLAFDAERRPLLYAIESEEKRLVFGVVMRADFPIYRRDERMGEYYVIYKADEIRKMAEKYLFESRQNDVNIMHQEDSDVDGVQMVQYFIKDSAKGVNPAGFEDIADGSLFAEFHILNDEVWGSIKEQTYKGFSLEGVFDLVPETDEDEIKEIVDILDGAFRKLIKPNTKEMSKLSRFKSALAKMLQEMGNITTDKGVLAWDGDADIAVGDEAFIEDAEGNRTPAEDGEYRTEDNKVIVIAEGKVAEIKDAEVEPVAEPSDEPVAEPEIVNDFAEVATDNGVLICDGELEIGKEVFVATEEGNIPAPDGEYKTEDGKVIKVENGMIAEIAEAEKETEPVAEPSEEVEVLRKENESLKAEVESLKAKVAEMQKMSAAKPAHEEIKTSFQYQRTGDKGLDRLASYLSK